jgi:hypothetical protein
LITAATPPGINGAHCRAKYAARGDPDQLRVRILHCQVLTVLKPCKNKDKPDDQPGELNDNVVWMIEKHLLSPTTAPAGAPSRSFCYLGRFLGQNSGQNNGNFRQMFSKHSDMKLPCLKSTNVPLSLPQDQHMVCIVCHLTYM